MPTSVSVADAIDRLARDPLRNIVALKHLLAYPKHVRVHQVSDARRSAMLVTLDASVSAYDRETYPYARVVAFIVSDHPSLTAALMPHIPGDCGIVFKLSQETDLSPIAAQFPIERRTAFVSFTSAGRYKPDCHAAITQAPSDSAFDLFERQGHHRGWLEPLLIDGKAFACALVRSGEALSACFAFENYGPVWEVGGVVTAASHRRKGLAARVVRTALAELARRGKAPRYQVEETNDASIRLARSVGLAPFLTIVHYEHQCW